MEKVIHIYFKKRIQNLDLKSHTIFYLYIYIYILLSLNKRKYTGDDILGIQNKDGWTKSDTQSMQSKQAYSID